LVWQKSLDFIDYIYKISNGFPTEEKFGLQSQLRRAAISIALNIAEGSGRSTKKDFRRFLHDSIGSLREVVTCLHIAKRHKYINYTEFGTAYEQCTELSKMLYSLAKSLSDI